MTNQTAIIVLAAGLGTRMKSQKAKVLHEVCGRSMIEYVVDAAVQVVGHNVIVVVGHQAELVREVLRGYPRIGFALQEKQRGTGHAVLCALPCLAENITDVVVLCGDVPLIKSATIESMLAAHRQDKRDVTILGVQLSDPKGYGRLFFDSSGNLAGIVEEADANEAQKKINIVNSGIYAVNRLFLTEALPQIKPDNKQNEIYLTDIIAIAYRQKRKLGLAMAADSKEISGVNSPDDLLAVENIMKSGSSEIS